MAIHNNLTSLFNNTANSIRGKTGWTNAIVADNFPAAINAIDTKSNTPGTATNADILASKTAWVNGSQLTGTIATRSASNVTVSGNYINTQAGYYPSNVSKSVNAGSATTPATTITIGAPTLSLNATTGIVSSTAPSKTQNVTPTVVAGYVTAGTAGTITAKSTASNVNIGLATLSKSNASAGLSSDGLWNGSSLNSSDKITLATESAANYYKLTASGSGGAIITAPGYIANNTSNSNTAANAYWIAKSNLADGLIIVPHTDGTSATVNVSAGYINQTKTITVTGMPQGELSKYDAYAGTSVSSDGLYNSSNGGVNTSDRMSITSSATNGYYRLTSTGYGGAIVTKRGFLEVGTNNTTIANHQTFIAKGSVNKTSVTPSTSSQTVRVTQGYIPSNVDITISAMASGALSASGNGAASTPSFSVNTSTAVLTASVAKSTGTARANVSTNGYVDTSKNTSATFDITASSNTYNILAKNPGTLSKTAATSTTASSGLVTNISNGAVNASDKILTVAGANEKYKISGTGGAGANVTTAGWLAAGTTVSNSTSSAIYVNKATATSTQPNASATAGTASVTLTNIASSSSATDYKIVATATGGSASITAGSATISEGYAPTATTASVSAKSASGATNTQTVYLKKATSSVTNQTVTGTTAGTAASATTSITGMETTTTNTGFIVSASASANSGTITGGTKTAYANITDGYSASAVSASAVATVSNVSAVTKSNSNTQYIKAATVSDYSAKYKAQSKPTFSINTTTGIVTASVAATSQDVYRNVSTGYVGTANTTKMTFTMNASSNTYNVGVGGRSASLNGLASIGLVTNAGNGAVNSSDKADQVTTTKTNSYYQLNVNAVATTTAGYITAGSTGNYTPYIYIKKGSAATPATTVYTGKVGMSFNATTGIVTASSVSGTSSVTPTVTEGYVKSGTAGTITATSNSNTYNVGLGSRSAGLQSVTPAGIVNNISNNSVDPNSKVLLATGANGKYRVDLNTKATTTAGYINAGTTYNADLGQSIYLNSLTLSSESNSVTASGKTVTYNIKSWTSEGYASKSLTTWINGTKDVATGSVSDFSAKYKAQSKPTFSIDKPNGVVTASVAQTTQAVYRNVSAGYVSANTTGMTFTMNASSNTYTLPEVGFSSPTGYPNTRFTSEGLVTNASNGAVNASDNIAFTQTATNSYYRINADAAYSITNNLQGGGWFAGGRYISDIWDRYIYIAKSNAISVNLTPSTSGIITMPFSAGYVRNDFTINVEKIATGTLAAGTAAVLNNSNGRIRYYRNVSTAGYIAKNTTAYYLQLNTKGGSTTSVNGTAITLVNAGQFVTGAIIAQAQAANYNSSTFDLTYPGGIVTIT